MRGRTEITDGYASRPLCLFCDSCCGELGPTCENWNSLKPGKHQSVLTNSIDGSDDSYSS